MKTTLRISFLIMTIVFSSCKQLKVSERELAAIGEIGSLYGGTSTYTINLAASTKYGKTRSFEIEIENSEFLNENENWAEMFAANMAYVFFTFIKEESGKYNSVRSSIVYRDRGKASFDYSIDSLQMVYDKMAFVGQIVNDLRHHNYDKIQAMIKYGDFLKEEDKAKYFSELRAVDSSFGDIIDFTPTGFKFTNLGNGNDYLHISGNLKRTKQDTQFSIDINSTMGRDELYFYGYVY